MVVGNGAREHALTWKLRQSRQIQDIFIAPGNPGTAALGRNLELSADDAEGLAAAVRTNSIGLVVIGPEGPLAAGLADRLRLEDVAVFGPSGRAARIESSKGFAKSLMQQAAIPTAAAATFDDYQRAADYVRSAANPPVVKADGLAAGKGVTVARDTAEALAALRDAMVDRAFGEAGSSVVIEERLHGREVSAHAFSDGRTVVSLPYACDHKTIGEGGAGPNTGGMGAYSPPDFIDDDLDRLIQAQIVQATVMALAASGSEYRGLLYPGLMITDAGPRVIEFNCRFGDPETQVLLPRMRSDLFDPLWGSAIGDLRSVTVDWSPDACVGVVLAAEGYPGRVRQGDLITGIEDVDPDVLIFQAGTARDLDRRLVTAGGRVLTVVATGPTLSAARDRVYANLERVNFTGRNFRRDIGSAAH
jgi:phosphoribosylamine---glycine ligase